MLDLGGDVQHDGQVGQDVADGELVDLLHRVEREVAGDALPDLTVVLDVPTEVGVARVHQRASDLPNRMERENIEFYKKVRDGYLLLARSLPKRFFVVDGTLPEEKIRKLIWAEVKKRLG